MQTHGNTVVVPGFPRVSPRDQWIGWSDKVREANLSQVVNNSRFLIFPWVEIPNLASHILSLAARQIVPDWEAMYKVRPVLLETLVDRDRYPGTCYQSRRRLRVILADSPDP